jgi:hypothetical protein
MLKKTGFTQYCLLHGDATAYNNAIRQSYSSLLLIFIGQVYMKDNGNVYWQSSVFSWLDAALRIHTTVVEESMANSGSEKRIKQNKQWSLEMVCIKYRMLGCLNVM